MKQFNLEEAKAGKSVRTRNGFPVRIVCYDVNNNSHFPIIGLVTVNGFEKPVLYTEKGCEYTDMSSPYDLFMELEKHTMWLNIYKNHCNNYTSGSLQLTEEEADSCVSSGRVAKVKVEWYD